MAKSKKNGRNKNGNGKKDDPAPPASASKPRAPVAPPRGKLVAGNPIAQLAAAERDRAAADFSQAVAVLMRAPNYKNLRIADLEWLLIPPLLTGQSRVALSRFTKDGPIVPVALALWARVSESVDKRLSDNPDKPPLLKASEWTSGNILWLIVLAGEPQALATFLPQLRKSVFKDKPVKLRVQKAGGKTIVTTLEATASEKG